ncbi:MAG TPA: Uma2 family endonuclease [Myxococcota bacterium]|jgi:Uma2 family endonuclease|nr:Uma2 family endonuclease [Myxococcota bacterium]
MTTPLKVGDLVNVHLTYDDYAALPDDGRRYQLFEGDLDVTPAPSPAHQRISRNLQLELMLHVRDQRLGAVYNAPIDVIVADDTIVQPDLVFLRREQLGLVSARGIEGAPDLIIEILSPKTARVDRTTKMRLYARAGVREYWIVDPDAAAVEVYALAERTFELAATAARGGQVRSPLLPELVLPVDAIFADDV